MKVLVNQNQLVVLIPHSQRIQRIWFSIRIHRWCHRCSKQTTSYWNTIQIRGCWCREEHRSIQWFNRTQDNRNTIHQLQSWSYWFWCCWQRETVQKQEQSDTKVLVLYSVFLEPQSPDLSIQSTRQLCSDLLVQVLNVLLVKQIGSGGLFAFVSKTEIRVASPESDGLFKISGVAQTPRARDLMDRVLSTSTPSLQFWMSTARQSSSVQKRELLPFHQLLERYSRSTVLQKQIQSETTLVVEHYSDLVEEQKELHSYRRQQHSSTLLEQQEKRELHHMLVLVLSLHSTARRNPLLSTVQQVESSKLRWFCRCISFSSTSCWFWISIRICQQDRDCHILPTIGQSLPHQRFRRCQKDKCIRGFWFCIYICQHNFSKNCPISDAARTLQSYWSIQRIFHQNRIYRSK